MDSIGAEVHRSAWFQEIVRANAALRGEVPDAGICVRARLGWVEGVEIAYRWIFVVGPHHAACCLYPGHKPFAMCEIPSHLYGCDADSGESAADGVGPDAGGIGGCSSATQSLELRRIGLPEREYLDRILKIAAEKTSPELWSEDFTQVTPDHEEAEVRAVFETNSALEEHTVLPGSSQGLLFRCCNIQDARRSLHIRGLRVMDVARRTIARVIGGRTGWWCR